MRWNVGLLFLVGCAGDAEISRVSEVDVEAPPATADRPAPTADRRDEPPPSALDAWHVPGATELLGAACEKSAPPQSPAGQLPVPRCGTKARVAIEQASARSPNLEKLPCTMRSLDDGAPMTPYAKSACVEGDHLIVMSACIMCRIISSTTVHARLSELDAEQHAYLRRLVGKDGDSPATPGEWRALVEKGKPISPLTE